ncbi:MAG TPA: ABC transporter permease [Limnochordales bacterium]
MSRAVWVVARREWRALITSRAYRFGTVVGALAIVALALLPSLLARSQQVSPTEVAVVDEVGGVLEQLRAVEASLPPVLRPPVVWQDAGAGGGGEGGGATLRIRRDADGELEFVVSGPGASPSLVRGLQQLATPVAVADRARRWGIDLALMASLQQPARMRVESGSPQPAPAAASAVPASGEILALLLMVMLYMTLTLYGSVVANGVAAEKGGRVVEMLLVAARPGELLRGKLAGIATASLLQYAIWGAVGSGVFALQRGALGETLSSMVGVPVRIEGIPLWLVGYLALFFLLGFVTFGALFAAAASLASRPEEASQTVWPPTMLMLAGYFLAFFVVVDPSSRLAVVSSLLPFVGPLTMFVRIAVGAVPAAQIVGGVAVSAATALATLHLAERVYRASLLRTRRGTWMGALREGAPIR